MRGRAANRPTHPKTALFLNHAPAALVPAWRRVVADVTGRHAGGWWSCWEKV